jgi:membrane protease YdiL (CAAX protease family)
MRQSSLAGALQVMLAVWTVLLSGPPLSSLIGGEPATLLVFCLAAVLLVGTRRSAVARPRLRHAALFGLAIALGFVGHSPLRIVIALVGLALGIDPGAAPSPGTAGLPLLIAVVLIGPVFEELLYRERLLDAIAATPLGMAGATLLSSALFALTHLTPWQMLGSFLVGLLLAGVRRVSRTVMACIGLHAGLNLRSVWDCAGGALHG